MKDDNPESVTREALLRFLETVPSGAARRGPDSMMAEERAAPAGPNLACPSPERYMDVALGTGGVEQSYALLEHAASCSECASVLASSLRALEGNPSAEESAALAELAEQREWLERMAEALAATPARKRPLAVMETIRYGGRRWRWLAAGAAAALVAAAGAGIMWQRHATAPENLLAKAYQQSRTLELRIPEAGFANLTAGGHTRGAGGDDEPAPLLEARAGLARKLQTSPEDARLLELQARADVLAEHYDRAVDVLDRLLATGPVTAELLTDGAMAYYQRGLVSNRELDRSTALDYLRRADEIAPTDPVVLFNEAVVMEDRGQMMNAVEVWNRYLTVERDGAWAREGKRKLAALEAALNRLKSHESRVDKMLATPEAMNALAGDPAKLAALDEELSTYRLMRLTQRAFPEARGSPCDDFCQAARRLLQATGKSLENHHHDFWLSDLLPASFDALPETTKDDYAQAMRLLGRAAYENQFGVPALGKGLAGQARLLFANLTQRSGRNAAVRRVMITGEHRSAVEYLYGLQRTVNFKGCRAFAQQLHRGGEYQAARASYPLLSSPSTRYPWVEGMEMITEKVCDDTPETRAAGRKLEAQALLLAETANYPLLRARVDLRIANDAQDAGDEETYERQTLAVLHELVSMDPPLTRIVQTVASVMYADRDSPRAHTAELGFRETLSWTEAAGADVAEIATRMELVDAEMRIGARTEAENQLRKASSEIAAHGWAKSRAVDLWDAETYLARSMLERGDSAAAARFLNDASGYMSGDSDTWLQRRYDAALGQLDLTRKDYDHARRSLESNIRMSEGNGVRQTDRVAVAEYAAQDHDIYAELAATWLGLGRSPLSVLALWERFQMHSRGLPVMACAGEALDCEESSLLAEQHRLGSNVLIGQILLLDRVLVYRMDNQGVTWTEKPVRRQDVLDAAQTLERAVSSPFTSMATAAQLGAHLSDALLPEIPAKLDPDAALLLEPDPMLQNLSWPVLPTPAGPLGLRYPLAEVTSILADSGPANSALTGAGHTSSVDGTMNRALVVGASVAEDEPPLPDALTEAQAVNGFLHAPDLLLGDQATAARVAQRMTTATIFHFAGHAVQSRDGTELLLASVSPRSVSLGSASSGAEKQRARPWIDGTFLRQHPPRACRLAVLSACATGQREASWNHPLQDIVETLRSLGVPEVVATRWQIDSEATVPFMNSFYESLKDGSSVAAALTVARRVQSGRSSYASPYYWGAYYVSGREAMRFKGEFYGHL